jgi:hypothetical protein
MQWKRRVEGYGLTIRFASVALMLVTDSADTPKGVNYEHHAIAGCVSQQL